jgi:UDP-N-acetylmuramoyl-tripeptide--D-alanyl-D-alanine ligase
MRHHTPARVFTYGLSCQAALWADEVASEGLEGVRFVFHYQGEAIHVKVPLLGRHSVHTALRAAAIGLNQGMHWGEIVAGLQDNNTGLRLVAVPGPRGSIILDDTYNASPVSGIAALNLLDELSARRKIAVLGYMAELGSYEDEGHRKVGCRAAGVVDILLVLDARAKNIAEEAAACGLNAEAIHLVQNSRQALNILQKTVQNGDTILVKGSRSMEMESIVAGLSVRAESS